MKSKSRRLPRSHRHLAHLVVGCVMAVVLLPSSGWAAMQAELRRQSDGTVAAGLTFPRPTGGQAWVVANEFVRVVVQANLSKWGLRLTTNNRGVGLETPRFGGLPIFPTFGPITQGGGQGAFYGGLVGETVGQFRDPLTGEPVHGLINHAPIAYQVWRVTNGQREVGVRFEPGVITRDEDVSDGTEQEISELKPWVFMGDRGSFENIRTSPPVPVDPLDPFFAALAGIPSRTFLQAHPPIGLVRNRSTGSLERRHTNPAVVDIFFAARLGLAAPDRYSFVIDLELVQYE